MTEHQRMKSSISELINRLGVVRHGDILDFYTDQQLAMQVLSELVMESLIKRIEYILPDSTVRRAIYFPARTLVE